MASAEDRGIDSGTVSLWTQETGFPEEAQEVLDMAPEKVSWMMFIPHSMPGLVAGYQTRVEMLEGYLFIV